MVISNNISSFLIHHESSIGDALNKIDQFKSRLLCVVDEKERILGVVTNGDILRWFKDEDEIDKKKPISTLANRDFCFVKEQEDKQVINQHLDKFLIVPIVNQRMQLIALAFREGTIDGFKISDAHVGGSESSTYVIAEIGNNHNGDLSLARRLVEDCVKAGANCAKFQMRQLGSLYSNAGSSDDDSENLGSQYTLDLLNKFQLSNEELISVFDYCKELGIEPLCTPWDSASLAILEDYGMNAYKIASADLTNHDLLLEIAETGKPMICSTGMSSDEEIIEAANLLKNAGAQFILLHCNSTYPAPFQDINLRYLSRLKKLSGRCVGYSGHERGLFTSVSAVALGAKVIERHITVDRNMEGNDHKVSLLPLEFAELVSGIREVEQSLGSDKKRSLTQGEMMNRVNLSKSMIAKKDIAEGETITDQMIDIKSPGRGLQPNLKNQLIGKRSNRSLAKGDFFYASDLEERNITSRTFEFKRPWGIPVRYYDFSTLIKGSNLDFVEFHLSYKDLEVDFSKYIKKTQPIQFSVHCPELFKDDHLLDLTSPIAEYRSRSILEVQRVIELTERLGEFFPNTNKPFIVVNVGGWSKHGFLSDEELIVRKQNLKDSISQLHHENVELLPQTMPPFPWHFGGQSHHNLFVRDDDILKLCADLGLRVCLDVSHSKLACNFYKIPFSKFLEKVGPMTAYLHIADAKNNGEEGLKIGEGDMDFYQLDKDLNAHAAGCWFIPEIWQGHENNGEGFWQALHKLDTIV